MGKKGLHAAKREMIENEPTLGLGAGAAGGSGGVGVAMPVTNEENGREPAGRKVFINDPCIGIGESQLPKQLLPNIYAEENYNVVLTFGAGAGPGAGAGRVQSFQLCLC